MKKCAINASIECMATLTIRNLDDDVKERLRVRAAQAGHSMEEEARAILGQAVSPRAMTGAELLAVSRQLFGEVCGVDLELPDRGGDRPPPDFSGPEYGSPRKKRP